MTDDIPPSDRRRLQLVQIQLEWVCAELKSHRKLLIAITISQLLIFLIVAVDMAAKWLPPGWRPSALPLGIE
jgi:hypothetical protein